LAYSNFIKNAEKLKSKVPLEKTDEKKVINYAKEKGHWALKLSILGERGFPDISIFTNKGRVFFVEMKRRGCKKKLTINQKKKRNKLQSLGFSYYVCDTFNEAKSIIDNATGFERIFYYPWKSQ